jgi:hypothetical protein
VPTKACAVVNSYCGIATAIRINLNAIYTWARKVAAIDRWARTASERPHVMVAGQRALSLP